MPDLAFNDLADLRREIGESGGGPPAFAGSSLGDWLGPAAVYEDGVMDPRQRFSSTVEDYRRYRPDYPAALFDWIEEVAQLGPGATVIDVGCGTGISSRQLAARGWRVIGVDPNVAMLEAAREEGGGPTYVQTDAERLAVPVSHADAIVGGQSFHWIDLERARPRFEALLGPARDRARVIAFWNLRVEHDPLMAEYEALLRRWSPEYAEVGAEPRARSIAATTDGATASFAHAQSFDRAGFHGRAWSSSYVKNVVTDREAFDAELDALFDRFARDGRVRFVYETLAITLM